MTKSQLTSVLSTYNKTYFSCVCIYSFFFNLTHPTSQPGASLELVSSFYCPTWLSLSNQLECVIGNMHLIFWRGSYIFIELMHSSQRRKSKWWIAMGMHLISAGCVYSQLQFCDNGYYNKFVSTFMHTQQIFLTFIFFSSTDFSEALKHWFYGGAIKRGIDDFAFIGHFFVNCLFSGFQVFWK